MKNYSQDAELGVIVHNKSERFTIVAINGVDGQPIKDIPEVAFYVDRLNNKES